MLPGATQVVNSATAASSTPDPDPSDNTGSCDHGGRARTADRCGSRGQQGRYGTASAASGTQVTYTLTVMNHGPAAANNVVLTDSLPAGVQLVSATAAPGACTGTNPVTCTWPPPCPSGDTLTAMIVVRVLPGAYRDAGRHRDGQQPDQPDPTPTNNTATAQTTVTGAGRPPPHEERRARRSRRTARPRLHAHGDQRGSVEGNERHRGRSAARRREAGCRHGEPGDLHDGGPTITCALGDLAPERQRDGDDRGDPRTNDNAFSNTANVSATESDPIPPTTRRPSPYPA